MRNKNIKYIFDHNSNLVQVELSPSKFEELIEKLEDLHDIKTIEKLKTKKIKSRPLEDVMREIKKR